MDRALPLMERALPLMERPLLLLDRALPLMERPLPLRTAIWPTQPHSSTERRMGHQGVPYIVLIVLEQTVRTWAGVRKLK